jgi:hypothetical protein
MRSEGDAMLPHSGTMRISLPLRNSSPETIADASGALRESPYARLRSEVEKRQKMSASPATASQPTKLTDQELAAVLDRFQNWTAARQAQVAPTPPPPRPAVRELSYEEALRLGRHRGSVPNLAGPKASASSEALTAASPSPSPSARAGIAAMSGAREASGTFLNELDEALANLKAATREQEADPPAAPAQPLQKRQISAAMGTAKVRRSVPLTVRVTAAEDEQIRAQAAAASLSVSDYLRSAVFEVDRLRAQLAQSVNALHQAMAASPAALPTHIAHPISAPAPGIVARLFRRFKGTHCSIYT